MAKSSGKSSSKSSNRPSAPRTTGRPKPVLAKAGYTQTRRRYGEGGKA